MSPDIYVESRHIGYAILWGFKLAIFYDVFLIFRNVIKHKNFFIYAEDFIYWILCAVFVFEHIYEIGNGYIRWYMALGVGIGMLAYKLTISKWLVQGVSFVLNKMKGIYCAKISSINEAVLCREHNDANVIAISADIELELGSDYYSSLITKKIVISER